MKQNEGYPEVAFGWRIRLLLILLFASIQFAVFIRLVDFLTCIILSLLGAFFFSCSLECFCMSRLDSSRFYFYLKIGFIPLLLGIITLFPVYPDTLLKHLPLGQTVLDDRTELLTEAIEKEDKTSIKLLMLIGIGDAEPRYYSTGDPLIRRVKDPDILNTLLASGLNPNIKDGLGRTMLMSVKDAALARVLINNGADVNAQDDDGLTALMHAHKAPLEYVRFLLLSNGKPLPGSIDPGSSIVHEDWLEPKGPLTDLKSNISVSPESLAYGDIADVIIRIVNSENIDRIVNIEARFNPVALFLSASDRGKIAKPFDEPQMDQTIRWRRLSLPANRTGILKMSDAT